MFPFWKHLTAFFRNKRWKVIGFTEGSIFSNVARTYFYRSFVVFKQRTTFFFSSKQVDYSAETAIFFFMEK